MVRGYRLMADICGLAHRLLNSIGKGTSKKSFFFCFTCVIMNKTKKEELLMNTKCMQYYYQMADISVESDWQLPYAYSIQNVNEADVTIERMTSKHKDIDKLLTSHASGVSMQYYYTKGEAFYSYKNQGFFHVSDGKHIEYYLYEGYKESSIVHTLLCQCFGAILAQRDMIGIHSGVCFIKDKSVILCGDSGAGKTTLTAELMKRGAEFMADDTACISVDESRVLVHALVPFRKLCEDTLLQYPCASEEVVKLPDDEKIKYGIRENSFFHISPEPVGAMFWIRVGSEKQVVLQPITGFQKLEAVRQNLYAKGAYNDLFKSPDFFHKLATFCEQVPMYELIRPSEEMTIKEMADTVERVLLEKE